MATISVKVELRVSRLVRPLAVVLGPLVRCGALSEKAVKRFLLRLLRYRTNGGRWKRFRASRRAEIVS